MSVHFFSEDVPNPITESELITRWLEGIIIEHNYTLQELNYIFCSDQYLHKMNLSYLNHDTYTDIITFDNSELEHEIEGDVFISTDRIKENAADFKSSFDDELHRVLCHGLLHLLGFGDKSESEKAEMRKKEDACLSLLSKNK